jgi:DNA-binding transcriptional LysR family regulator
MEHTGGAVHALVVRWLGGKAPRRAPMHLGTIEALKSAVASNLGMSIVPEVSVSRSTTDIVARPLRPPLSRTLALIEHRNKQSDQAMDTVRKALLALRSDRKTGLERA